MCAFGHQYKFSTRSFYIKPNKNKKRIPFIFNVGILCTKNVFVVEFILHIIIFIIIETDVSAQNFR